jgi:hypothetical protein
MARSYSDVGSGREAEYLAMEADSPDRRVSASEKCGGVGIWSVREEMGKYSGQGRPPPREMRPGVLRCLAACLRAQGARRADSVVRWSGGKG